MTNEEIQHEIDDLLQAIAQQEKSIAYGIYLGSGQKYKRGDTQKNRAQLRWFCEQLEGLQKLLAYQKRKKIDPYKIVAIEHERTDQPADSDED